MLFVLLLWIFWKFINIQLKDRNSHERTNLESSTILRHIIMESYPNPEDLEYEPKISESTNYLKFLKLTHDGHHSEDEGHYDSEGYYEDDIVGDIVRTESDQNFLYSDLPEVGKDALQIFSYLPLSLNDT